MLELPYFERVVDKAWNAKQHGPLMYQVCNRIKSCRVALLKLKGLHHLNSGKAIQAIKDKMIVMLLEGGARNWTELKQLQKTLGEEYKKQESYWHQKLRVQWLAEGEKKLQVLPCFYYAEKEEELH